MFDKTVLIVVVFLGLQIAGNHVLGGDLGAVGEGGVGVQVDGPVTAVVGDFVLSAENGSNIFLAVHSKQSLVHQRHEYPVGVVTAEQGVQGAVRVVGQGQLLGILLFRHNVLRVLPFHQDGIAGGLVAGVINFPTAAPQNQNRNQQQSCQSFHGQTSLQTIRAPWEPRSPLVARWDQNR